MDIFEARESAVRSYCRMWPTVFGRAAGSRLYDEQGHGYLDFFAGAGALNYGHNNPMLKGALLRYLADDGVIHSLDMHTVARREFLTVFDELILRPRQLDYRVQFPGPGGANAVEAALGLRQDRPVLQLRAFGDHPDIVCLSKSISGYGLPLALTLIRPDLDIWAPGEHNGTFRGVNPALVTGTAALRAYWSDDSLERSTLAKGERIVAAVTATADSVPGAPIQVRGRGMACGQVVKLLPPLTISGAELDEGLSVLDESIRAVC